MKERAKHQPADIIRFGDSMRGVIDSMARLPVPVVAALDGAALGGGAELALGADFRTASSRALMGFPETGLGIIPGVGGTRFSTPREPGDHSHRLPFRGSHHQVAAPAMQTSDPLITIKVPDRLRDIFSDAHSLVAGTQRTLRLIGAPRTKLLLFTGRRLSGEEAVDWGLADILSENPEEVPAV